MTPGGAKSRGWEFDSVRRSAPTPPLHPWRLNFGLLRVPKALFRLGPPAALRVLVLARALARAAGVGTGSRGAARKNPDRCAKPQPIITVNDMSKIIFSLTSSMVAELPFGPPDTCSADAPYNSFVMCPLTQTLHHVLFYELAVLESLPNYDKLFLPIQLDISCLHYLLSLETEIC